MYMYVIQTSYNLQWQQYDDRQPVEHVVDSGPRERPTKVALVDDLTEGDYRVGYWRADVRPHHHGDGRSYTED